MEKLFTEQQEIADEINWAYSNFKKKNHDISVRLNLLKKVNTNLTYKRHNSTKTQQSLNVKKTFL